MVRCFFVPEGKINELTGKLRATSKNQDEGIVEHIVSQGVTGKNAAIFYAKESRPAQLTAQKIAKECRATTPIPLEWLVSGKTTLAAFRGAIPNLKGMEPAIRFAVFVGTNGFLAQIAEEHGESPMHMKKGDTVLELDTTTGRTREIRVAPVNDDAHENGDEKQNDAL